MKRSEALAPLSRDHHRGLFAALKLKRGAPDARETFLEFFRHEGDVHFALEEALLLPALARHRGAEDEVIVRVLVEHVDLRRRAQDLAREPATADDLRELGRRLEAHIRHEETIVFPLIEEILSAEELSSLGAEIIHRHP